MPSFLCFRLYGPLTSWGDVAVGDRRPSSNRPSRSAVLGLLAGALGLDREQETQILELEAGLGFASMVLASGELLVDFHTAQVLPASAVTQRNLKGRQRPATRAEALAFDSERLETIVTTRQYRMDALATVCVWRRAESAPALEVLASALQTPKFIPYLGRRSCSAGVPFEPQLIDAAHPVRAMAAAKFRSDDWLNELRSQKQGVAMHWEGEWTGFENARRSVRRDRLVSRMRWQFAERTEHQVIVGSLEELNVPEQN